MLFRKATMEDIPAVEIVLNDAKASMKDSGIDQWQDGYPNKEVIANDIEYGQSYVVEVDGDVKATCMITTDVESTYQVIDGAWLNDDPCIVVHRIACKNDALKLGIASHCIDQAFRLFPSYKNIKIDTHHDNMKMQGFLKKNGFIYCGVIFLEDGNLRVAFQKTI